MLMMMTTTTVISSVEKENLFVFDTSVGCDISHEERKREREMFM